jgi:hypothetical protein
MPGFLIGSSERPTLDAEFHPETDLAHRQRAAANCGLSGLGAKRPAEDKCTALSSVEEFRGHP